MLKWITIENLTGIYWICLITCIPALYSQSESALPDVRLNCVPESVVQTESKSQNFEHMH